MPNDTTINKNTQQPEKHPTQKKFCEENFSQDSDLLLNKKSAHQPTQHDIDTQGHRQGSAAEQPTAAHPQKQAHHTPSSPTTPTDDVGEPQRMSGETPSETSGEMSDNPLDVSHQEKLAQENMALKDHLLRSVAEFENFKKRTLREQEDIKKYAIHRFAQDILSVGDNLNRALESISKDLLGDAMDESLKKLVEGIRLVQGEFFASLKRHHVEKIEAKNEVFNPEFHQAMMEKEAGPSMEGRVVEVFQEGYKIQGRLLRPALVIVGKQGSTDPSADKSGNGPPSSS